MLPICDTNFMVTFSSEAVVVLDATNRSILTGCREGQGPYLWRITLLPDNADIPEVPQDASRVSLVAYSAYDLPSVSALVRYFHAAAGFPVRSICLYAIKSGNYASWPGLTRNKARNYCPSANKMILGHLVQGRQGLRSTKRGRRGARSPATPATMPAPTGGTSDNKLSHSKELYIQVRHISKLYTDDTGQFPVRARSGNQYVMIAYHCDLNVILAFPFGSCKDVHRLGAYNAIMERLKIRGQYVDLQVLDNEASETYRQLNTDKWKADFQLVLPNIHRRNAAEQAIRTFKSHFLAILTGVAPDYPRNMWDLLIP